MPAPTRPLTISPVMIGPLSLIMENTMTAGRKDLSPNRIKLSRVCRDRTTPVAAPASATSGSDFDPISSLTQEFAEFIRRNQGGAEQTRTEKAQFAKPFKYRYEQILREGKAHSCAAERARNGGSKDKNREIYQCTNSWP